MARRDDHSTPGTGGRSTPGGISWPELKAAVQVHTSFRRLAAGDLAHFLEHALNPEIAFDAETLDGTAPASFARMAGAIREAGLRVSFHGPFVDLSAGSSDPAVRAVAARRYEQLLALVPLFRPVTVVAHAGYDWRRYGYFQPLWLEHSLRFWGEIAARLSPLGGRLVLENVFERGPGEMAELFARLAERDVGLCLDCGHAVAFGEEPLLNWVERLGPFVAELHLHDNGGERDEHLPVGRGGIDFGPTLERLFAMHPEPPLVTLEIHRRDELWESLAGLARFWPLARKR